MDIHDIPISPDGFYYLRAGAGLPVPRPYNRRWLVPKLLGPNPLAYALVSYQSLAVIPFAAFWFFHASGLALWPAGFAALLLSAQPGLRTSLRFPVLIDAPSFAMALVVAATARSGHPIAAAALSLVLGAVRETSPVFAALWAWSPWPLVGLAASGWWRKGVESDVPWLRHPFREAWNLRRSIGLHQNLYVYPFGGALVGLGYLDWRGWVAVAVAHAQLLAAQDTLRLTVWCAPVLCGAAAGAPDIWWGLMLFVTTMYKTTEV